MNYRKVKELFFPFSFNSSYLNSLTCKRHTNSYGIPASYFCCLRDYQLDIFINKEQTFLKIYLPGIKYLALKSTVQRPITFPVTVAILLPTLLKIDIYYK